MYGIEPNDNMIPLHLDHCVTTIIALQFLRVGVFTTHENIGYNPTALVNLLCELDILIRVN